MSNWLCVKVIFEAKAPIHIGYKQIGILKTTRCYITGRVIWGALTSRLTKMLYNNPNSEDYEKVGNFVRKNIISTYFFPALEKDENIKGGKFTITYEKHNLVVLIPRYTERSIKYNLQINDAQEMNHSVFERLFISSLVSTQIKHTTKSAEDHSIHETEYLNSKVRINGSVKKVYWVGYLFVNTDSHMDTKDSSVSNSNIQEEIIVTASNRTLPISNLLSTIFVGGEQNYGFGKLKVIYSKKITEDEKLFGNYSYKVEKKTVIEIGKDMPLIGHLKVSKRDIKRYYGKIEPFVWISWHRNDNHGTTSKRGSDITTENTGLCLVPGSIILDPQLQSVLIEEYGLLE